VTVGGIGDWRDVTEVEATDYPARHHRELADTTLTHSSALTLNILVQQCAIQERPKC